MSNALDFLFWITLEAQCHVCVLWQKSNQ